MTLLTGSVVFIDDELDDPDSGAYALLQEILSTGRPVATARAVPADRESWFEHWQSLAFVIIDWDLSPGSMGSTGGATLSAFERTKLYDFLVALMKRIYCPIFILSAEDTSDIERQLRENQDLTPSAGGLDQRIAVFPKDTVMNRLVEHLAGWVSASPTLSALKAWENEHDAAKNTLFTELNSLEPDWPVYIWQAADFDQVDPAYELASVISTNLLNRFNPVAFNEETLTNFSGKTSGEARRRVSQGRTSLPGRRLSERMVLPGDIFRLPDSQDGEIWINVSPACHTVGRLLKTAEDGTEVRQPVRLHLLRGVRMSWPTNEGDLKSMDSKDRANSIVVHTVLDGDPYKFTFADAQIVEWPNVRGHRVARLLPPFITRVQQLHAAYIQSEGLPRVTLALYASGESTSGK